MRKKSKSKRRKTSIRCYNKSSRRRTRNKSRISRRDGAKKKSKGLSIKKTLLSGALTGLVLGLAKKYGDKVSINDLNKYVNSLSLNEIQDFIYDIPYKFTTEDITYFKEPRHMHGGVGYEPKDLRIKVVDEIFEDILPLGYKVNTKLKPKIEDVINYAANGNIPQLRYIIQKLDKDIKNYRDSNGNTLIMNIIEYAGSTSGSYEVIPRENMLKAIVLLGENLIDINAKNNNGNTALHEAVYRYMPEAIDILLGLGADPLIKNNRGQTPIHSAITRGKIDLINHLIKRKAGINSKNSLNETVLERLVKLQNDHDFPFPDVMDTLQYLIKNDAHLTLKAFNRITSIPHIRSEYKNLLKRYKKRIVKG